MAGAVEPFCPGAKDGVWITGPPLVARCSFQCPLDAIPSQCVDDRAGSTDVSLEAQQNKLKKKLH